MVKLCFSLNFIPLDPDLDPRTQLNADPTGSGSTSLDKTGKQERSPDLYIYSKLDNLPEMDVEYVSLVLPLRRELLPAVLARVDGQLLMRAIMIKETNQHKWL